MQSVSSCGALIQIEQLRKKTGNAKTFGPALGQLGGQRDGPIALNGPENASRAQTSVLKLLGAGKRFFALACLYAVVWAHFIVS